MRFFDFLSPRRRREHKQRQITAIVELFDYNDPCYDLMSEDAERINQRRSLYADERRALGGHCYGMSASFYGASNTSIFDFHLATSRFLVLDSDLSRIHAKLGDVIWADMDLQVLPEDFAAVRLGDRWRSFTQVGTVSSTDPRIGTCLIGVYEAEWIEGGKSYWLLARSGNQLHSFSQMKRSSGWREINFSLTYRNDFDESSRVAQEITARKLSGAFEPRNRFIPSFAGEKVERGERFCAACGNRLTRWWETERAHAGCAHTRHLLARS